MGAVRGPARATGKGGTKEHGMPDREPIAEQMLESDDATAMPWAEATRRLTEEGRTSTFWLATARSDGRPHVRPVLAVWVDDALHFAASATTHKAKNLARDSHCAVTLGSGDLDIVVEGEATKVRDEGRLRRVAEAYASTYDWHVTVRDGALRVRRRTTSTPSRRRWPSGSVRVRRTGTTRPAGASLKRNREVADDYHGAGCNVMSTIGGQERGLNRSVTSPKR
jgi:hypothetical protein